MWTAALCALAFHAWLSPLHRGPDWRNLANSLNGAALQFNYVDQVIDIGLEKPKLGKVNLKDVLKTQGHSKKHLESVADWASRSRSFEFSLIERKGEKPRPLDCVSCGDHFAVFAGFKGVRSGRCVISRKVRDVSNLDFAANVSCWALPIVFDFHFESRAVPFEEILSSLRCKPNVFAPVLVKSNRQFLDARITPDLRLADFLSDLVGVSCCIESPSNKDNTRSGHTQSDSRHEQHAKSPIGHLPLGLKVLLFAPFIPAGVWLGFWGLRYGITRESFWRAYLLLLLGGSLGALGVFLIAVL